MVDAESPTPFTDKVIAWGESGSLFPSLVPDDKSQIALRSVQQIIKQQFPESNPVHDLHSTLFYCKPRFVYDYLKDKINPNIKKPYLYSDLSSNFFATWWSAPSEFVLPTEGLERFGEDQDIVVVKLGRTAVFDAWRDSARELFSYTLQRHGVLSCDLESMKKEPEFEWSLGESIPHISLNVNVGPGDLTKIDLPDTVRFDTITDGNVSVGDEDPHRFYLGL